MKKLAFIFAIALLATGAWATTPNTPSLVDTSLTATGTDWDADELVVADSTSDSPWGAGNEVSNLYVTWDATNLYIGADIISSGNAAIIYLDNGVAGGVSDFLSTNGYAGGWQRNINFPYNDIEFFFPAWDTNGGGTSAMWTTSGGNNASDTSGSATVQGGTNFTEIQVSWDTIYGLGAGVVPNGATISIVAVIMGGDDFGGPDSGPDNADFNGDGGPDAAGAMFQIVVDGDANGAPDAGIAPSTAGAVVPVELSIFSAN